MKKSIFSSLFAMLLLVLSQVDTKAQDNKVYSFVSMENPPTYPGGITALYQFLGKNIKYPKEAVDKNIQGNVFVSFTVNKDGSVSNIKVDRGIGGGADEEAVRVLKLMKNWNPGKQNGKPVNVAYNIPVKFTLNKGTNITVNTVANNRTAKSVNNPPKNGVYSFVSMENPPTYPGGIAALYQFLGKNIKYPKEAVDKKIQGNVFVSFIVGKDGSVSNIKVDRGIGGGADEEAVRVLKLMKNWNPGTQDGKHVNVAYNIPVRFSLTK